MDLPAYHCTYFFRFFRRVRGVFILALHSFAGYPFIPQIKPEALARIFVAAARISAPFALRSIRIHVRTLRGIDSLAGRIADVPKSTTNPTRFLSATGFTFLQSSAKSGSGFGAAASTTSLAKVWIQPSTEPSATLLVGPVIAMIQELEFGGAWKYPQ
jgi:hypothetical protein